ADELRPLHYFFNPLEEILAQRGIVEPPWGIGGDERSELSREDWQSIMEQVKKKKQENQELFARHPAVQKLVAEHVQLFAMSGEERETFLKGEPRPEFMFYPF